MFFPPCESRLPLSLHSCWSHRSSSLSLPARRLRKTLVTIPLNESIQVSPNLKANLIQVTISDMTYGGSFAEDQSKVIFPILVYNYQNVGSVPESGHLHIKFMDDQGQVYEGRDEGTMQPVQPGTTTDRQDYRDQHTEGPAGDRPGHRHGIQPADYSP